MSDNYWRLVSLVINVCPKPMLDLLIHNAKSDSNVTSPFTNIHDYLRSRSSDVNTLVFFKPTKYLSRSQRKQVLPACVSGSESEWDVTILASLLLGLFDGVLKRFETVHIKMIRDIRNELKHKGSTDNITDTEFQHIWDNIDSSMVFLTKACSGDLDAIHMRIRQTMSTPLPGLLNTIVGWSESTERECLTVCQIVDDAVVERRTKHGQPTYRFKTEDPILERLRELFYQHAIEIKTDKSDDSKIATILETLQAHSYVIVMGSGPSNQDDLRLAFCAVKKLNYDLDRCVMMKFSDDWRHVDPDEIDMVIYSLEGKSRDVKVLNDMFTVAQSGRLKVVVLSSDCETHSNKSVLSKVEHKKEAVVHIGSANESNNCKGMAQLEVGGVMSNMILMTKSYLEHQKDGSFAAGDILMAVKILENHKTLLVTSEDDLDHRQFLAPLVKSMNPGRVVLLMHPDDFKFVQPGQTDVLIIEHFLGKYRYDVQTGSRWCGYLDIFDTLLADEKLSAIVLTCHHNKLKDFQNEKHGHQLLQCMSQIKIEDSRVVAYSPKIQVDTTPARVPAIVVTPLSPVVHPRQNTIIGKSEAFLRYPNTRRRFHSLPVLMRQSKNDLQKPVCTVHRFQPSNVGMERDVSMKTDDRLAGRFRTAYMNIFEFCMMLYEYIEA